MPVQNVSGRPRPHDAARLLLRGLRSSHGGPFNLEVARGECVSVTGASGSGKSVLLRLIADLDPSTGEVSLDGWPRLEMPAPMWRRQVVYQAAEPGWWARTAGEHFEASVRPVVWRLLASLGIARSRLDAPIERLSTGERQRIALVRSLVHEPHVLLLDEPTASLDPASIAAVEVLFQDALARGCSIVLVTHSIEQAKRIGHRHLVLHDKTLHCL
ncbi:MAG: ABC transporter ATP-binding protein [Oxalobacteraceae bacterium]|jgi:ABC-type multidrug transport system ATPase subunit|nr:MAG: ABC transporter ATP-binding protein [Oxalobacteraceae bacterium]